MLKTFGNGHIRAGARVIITYQSFDSLKSKEKPSILFIGSLMTRADQGLTDKIIWKALDDRCQLNYIHTKGQIVRDSNGGKLKYITARKHELNPNGAWNCIGKKVSITTTSYDDDGKKTVVTKEVIVPVFADIARDGKLQEPTRAEYKDLEDGVLTAWTPKKYITHLAFLQILAWDHQSGNSAVAGLGPYWRSMASSDRINIDFFKWANISASTYASNDGGTDPLDYKLSPLNLQGMTFAGALDKILSVSKTHTLKTDYSIVTRLVVAGGTVTTEDGQTNFNLIPTFVNGEVQGSTDYIPLLIGGNASDIPDSNTAYDFQVYDDFTNVAGAVLIEGDTVKVEGRLTTKKGSIIKGWDSFDEETFKQIIEGNEDTGYAKYPTKDLGNPFGGTQSQFKDADGKGGRPLAYRWTSESVKLAREFCPDVFKKFKIDSSTDECMDLLSGAVGEFYNRTTNTSEFRRFYINEELYPKLKNRNVLQKQLQYMLGGDGNTEEEKTKTQYPIRLVFNYDTGPSEEGGSINIKVENDGSFYIDLAENRDTKYNCIYSGTLFNSSPLARPAPFDVDLRSFGLNIAMNMDNRLQSYVDVNSDINRAKPIASTLGLFGGKFAEDLGGVPIRYIDSSGYQQLHQVYSDPSPSVDYSFWNEKSNKWEEKTKPIDRILPAGNNDLDMEQAALRRLLDTSVSKRTSTFKIIGIRNAEYKCGQWFYNVKPLWGGENGSSFSFEDMMDRVVDYPLNAGVNTIVFDFVNNITTLSFRSEISNNY